MGTFLGLDKRYDWLAVLGLATSVAIVFFYYGDLPARIPSHFNGKGVVDGWSGKSMLFFLLAIEAGLFVLLGLTRLLTDKNSTNSLSTLQAKPGMEAEVKALNLSLMGVLRAIITISFAYIIWSIVQTALEQQNGLGSWFLVVFMLGVFLPLAYYTYEIFKRSK